MKIEAIKRLGCREAGRRMNAYADQELPAAEDREILHHLAGCSRCTQLAEENRRMKNLVRTAVNAVRVPAPLLASLRERLQNA